MAFSFSRLIISESNITISKETLDLIDGKEIKAQQRGTASCIGEIDGYDISLGFQRAVPIVLFPSTRIDVCSSTKKQSVEIDVGVSWPIHKVF